MLTKRIIPCLDVKDGRTVKGVNFVNLRDAGDAVELGAFYAEQGADELVFLDITATVEGRATLLELVRRVARTVNIPFTVGGGISSIADVSALLNAGADKVSINSAAVRNPDLINELALEFGSQCIVVAIDTKAPPAPDGGANNNKSKKAPIGGWGAFVHTHGGRKPTELRTVEWAKEVENRGAGEILLTSMDSDGTKNGFALELTAAISEAANIPVIASGGAGTMAHFYDVFTTGKADAGLAASIFHFKEIEIMALKSYLHERNVPMRMTR
ncbi:MAG: imidazole glycerol phosphate synthase subunit HisF [Cytophagia bacterium]|nr:MAG: imidazole glycerol phosphate synthase subunit HisF [Runella sp.]TAG21218.1 MAG: imidazole glycerol phosphate synthase subunit HisF [Cytophagales bacterium]TAG40309.1 MAG: imidazole glycerol phosphate synthase subunit HisF [Cytophagia bacterium]TAG50620.1 MAG: imidazole glycerol phosphate synthase subunit HisF [Runella slithyformis]TAG61593.1 MAG: imidazole glycerol phosphate synthase subunit HisF [Runella slithyformis]